MYNIFNTEISMDQKKTIVQILSIVFICGLVTWLSYIVITQPQLFYDSYYEIHHVTSKFNDKCDFNGSCFMELHFINVDYTKPDYQKRINIGVIQFFEERLIKSSTELQYYQTNYNNTYIWAGSGYGDYFPLGTTLLRHHIIVALLYIGFALSICGVIEIKN